MRDLGERRGARGSREGAGATGTSSLRAGGSATPSHTYRAFGAGIPEPEQVQSILRLVIEALNRLQGGKGFRSSSSLFCVLSSGRRKSRIDNIGPSGQGFRSRSTSSLFCNWRSGRHKPRID